MNSFTTKYYPPFILVFIVCLIVAIKFGLHELHNIFLKHDNQSHLANLLYIVISTGTVISIIRVVNQKLMGKWLLKLLDLCDLRGDYKGEIISSYHQDDDPSKPNIKLYCKFHIAQNLNGLQVKGDFFSDAAMTKHTSGFISEHEEIKKQLDGKFRIHYFYHNKGDLFHSHHMKYGLNNHEGICVLIYDPQSHQLEGYYFNRERSSHGKITMHRTATN